MTDLELASHATFLQSLAPTAEDLPLIQALLPYALPPAATLAPLLALDAALVAVWRELTPATVHAYIAALRPLAHTLGRVPPFQRSTLQEPGPIAPRRVGPWECVAFLGRGGSGQALAARHVATGQEVTLKLTAGAEPVVADWLGGVLPPEFLPIYAWGIADADYAAQPWVARQPAAETFVDFMRHRGGAPLPRPDVRALFRVACRGVAALHAHGIYRWSAHAGNVLRVGARWQLGDLGRCVVIARIADPRFIRYWSLEERSAVDRDRLLGICNGAPWQSALAGGLCAYDPMRVQRLKLDDCAMLGGLLVDLLAANRWQIFDRALATGCRGSYDLTGQRRRDRMLSGILNRCWLGDGGGALALAFGQDVTWEPFAGAGDLLAAVDDVLER